MIDLDKWEESIRLWVGRCMFCAGAIAGGAFVGLATWVF